VLAGICQVSLEVAFVDVTRENFPVKALTVSTSTWPCAAALTDFHADVVGEQQLKAVTAAASAAAGPYSLGFPNRDVSSVPVPLLQDNT
jgi:hypothetical protein